MSDPCPETIRTRLSAFLDGDLPAGERREVEAALADCGDCRAELDKLKRALGQLGGLKQSAPRSFLSDIERQIHTRSRGRFFAKRYRLFGRIPFEWVSFVMILAMLVYYIAVLQGSPAQVVPGP